EFYYQAGGGPMMDMGPYYMTALVNLVGRVKGVSGMCGKGFKQRIITSEPKRGTVVDVEVPTHTAGLLQFENGAIGTVLTTFDVYYDRQAFLEVYGTKGTLRVPDPNGFGGSISLLLPEDGSFKEMPLMFGYAENSRGLGLADMAKALRTGRPFRADVQQTLHVLEILTAFEKSSKEGRYLELTSPYQKRNAMQNLPVAGVLD
ncbi:MAG: gfo/Idh/MocA family oxidoreductase, partial [Lachnospiraceae bacterium]|nr:gfo/Idh/MocA family oxidoreductase [Lachnospiraceae bacterium]